MLGTSRAVAAFAILFACACGTGDTKVDPGDLELRDLLGVAPEVATSWDADQRAAARRILVENLEDREGEPIRIELAGAPSPDDQIARTLALLDTQRFAAGDGALGFVRVELTSSQLTARLAAAPAVVAVADGKPPQATVALELSERWGVLSDRSRDVLAALAIDAGHTSGALSVTPVPRLAVIASYTAGNPARLAVNPVLVAALDPSATAVMATARTGADALDVPPHAPPAPAVAAGNPYSFYGSIGECAYAQRLRCDSCVASGNCVPVTSTTDGNAECTTLGASDGRGYFLLCINQALAITSVQSCAASDVSGCARDTQAANDLGLLAANANFLDDSTCSAGLDGCLAKIYGAPKDPFPGIVDGGVTPPPDPPRNTDVSCGDSCDNDTSNNCEASPSCNCEGPSCNNSLSCDSTCASSNDQSGCGSCDSCESSSGGGGGGGGGGCSSDSSSGGGGGGCSGGSGGSCGGGDCGGGDCGGGSCGGGGGGSCQVTQKNPSAGFAVALSLTWALLPIPLAAVVKRRSRKKKRTASSTTDANEGSEPTAAEAARDEEVVS